MASNNVESKLCEGTRLVKIKLLGKNLRCCKCKEVLCLDNVINEQRFGGLFLHVILCQ